MHDNENDLLEKVPGLQVGKKFDLKSATECFGAYSEKRLSPYETLLSFNNVGFIIWAEGPRTGEIYRIIQFSDKEKLNKLPSVEQIEAKIKTALEEMEALDKKFKEYIPNEDVLGERYKISDQKRKRYAALLDYLYRLYYDPSTKHGVECAIFPNLDGRDQSYVSWLQLINEKGIARYLDTFVKKYSMDLFLSSGEDNDQRLVKNRLFYDMDDISDNLYRSDDPLVLKHATYSHSLVNIVQIGGLASRNYYESKGVRKRYGGEGGGRGSYTPDDVSFTVNRSNETTVYGGWGPERGFDYPIMLAISKSNARKLRESGAELKQGTLQSEGTVKDFVDLKFISHIFVPKFKIDEVKAILDSHGYGNIKVLSLGISQ